jgi:hypothetical protein
MSIYDNYDSICNQMRDTRQPSGQFKPSDEPAEPKRTYPIDFEKGWEYFRYFHICSICGEQGNENEDMIRDNLHEWVHKVCQERVIENAKNIKP